MQTFLQVIHARLQEPDGFWLSIDRGKGWARYDLYGVGADYLDVARQKRDGTSGERFLMPAHWIVGIRICEV